LESSHIVTTRRPGSHSIWYPAFIESLCPPIRSEGQGARAFLVKDLHLAARRDPVTEPSHRKTFKACSSQLVVDLTSSSLHSFKFPNKDIEHLFLSPAAVFSRISRRPTELRLHKFFSAPSDFRPKSLASSEWKILHFEFFQAVSSGPAADPSVRPLGCSVDLPSRLSHSECPS
jgi:hypothetical protein